MNQERLSKIIVAPHVSEKSTAAADKNHQHVFRVLTDASKREIRDAVEQLFNVKVDSVTTLVARGKVKRAGAGFGKRANFKKAYVRLQPGHDIDILGQ
ncbi:MAG: rplW [Gammaproteobacteria bacterium]|nr:MAG: rplW [Gammaproteobacteria bacterium]TND06583.1 MAG: rplW [Gammaproteobacteria bacterium]